MQRPKKEKKQDGSVFRTVMVFGTFIMLLVVSYDTYLTQSKKNEEAKQLSMIQEKPMDGCLGGICDQTSGFSKKVDASVVEQVVASRLQHGIEVMS